MSLYKEFKETYPSTVRHNEKIMAIHNIIRLEDKKELSVSERTELQRLRKKVKKM